MTERDFWALDDDSIERALARDAYIQEQLETWRLALVDKEALTPEVATAILLARL